MRLLTSSVTAVVLSAFSPLFSYADHLQTGVYLSGESLATTKSKDEGIGTQLKTFGADLHKTIPLNSTFDRYFTLGIGLTGGDDKKPFVQGVQQGSGGTVFYEESSIFGASIFGDIGLAKSLSANSMAFLGVGSNYSYLKREISDCSGCESEKINLSLAPYIKLGANFCGKRSCLDISYRYFITDDYINGVSLSWRMIRQHRH